MSKFLAKLLCAVMLINAVFSMSFGTVYAAEGSGFNFQWDTTMILDDSLELVSRGSEYDKALFWFNYGINDGLSFDDGEYKLSYHIADGKRIDVTIRKKAQVSTVTYKVWDYAKGAYLNVDDSVYQVYRPVSGTYVEPTSTTYPNADGSFCVNYNETTGKPDEVSFNIIKNTGFSFKFDNRTVKFKWVGGTSGDLFYFVTDGMKTGNVYDLSIDLQLNGSTDVTHKELEVFTGINTDTFTSTPYANDRKGDKTNPIDHTARPFADENPGYEPEIVLSFDMPKVWDDTKKAFDYPESSSMGEEDKTSVIIDMSNSSDKKKIQLNVDNIYASDINSVSKISTSSGAKLNAYTEGNRVCLNVTNLEAGTIYNPVEVSLYKPNNGNFLSASSELDLGTVYTYPEFSVISTASDEFYLKIEPYVGFSGFYTVYQGLTSGTLNQWAEYEDKTDGAASIYMPVDLNAINNKTRFFEVEFEITPPDNTPGVEVIKTTSQILKYTPDETDVVLGTPENLEVTGLNIVRSADGEKKEMVLSLKWDIAYTEVIKNLVKRNGGTLDVDYYFNKGDVPYDEKEEKFEKVTITFKLNGDDLEITMADEDGRLEDYSFTEKSEMIGEDEYKTTAANATFRFPVASIEEKSEQFLYPNVYFINIRGDYYVGNTHYTTGASLPVDITLDDIVDLELPQPQSFKVKDKSETATSFAVSWRALTSGTASSDLYNYNKSMLETIGLSIGEKSLKYNIYIAQKKTDLDNLIKYDTDRENTPSSVSGLIVSYDYGDETPDNGLNLTTAKDSDGTSLRDSLRNGKIVKIENVLQPEEASTIEMLLSGLDKNQNYYVVAETALLPYDSAKKEYVEDKFDHSNYCHMVTATTLKDSESPSDDENDPAAPSKFDKDEVEISSAKLIWNNVHEVADPSSKSKLEYQFIRVIGKKMDDSLIDSKLSYDKTWEKLPEGVEKAGWRTDGADTFSYSGTEFSSTPVSTDVLKYDNSNYTESTIVDNSLSPNELYFYYIRTVRVVDGEDKAYSVWVPLTLTTSPVQGPYDLEVLLNEEHDKETEVVIGFKLPHLDMDKLGTGYELQYSLKKDGEVWGEDITMDKALLTYEEAADGTINCKYLIKKLENGKLYHIKVRLYDKVLGDASLYSNIVSHRTDLNQDDYEEDHRKNSWSDHYLDLINDIIKKPYWLLEDTNIVTTAIYRPGPFKGLLAGTSESVIDLADGIGGSKKTYYIPGSAIEEAYAANKGFRIKYGEMDVIIGPKSIDPQYNDAIVDIKSKIDIDDIEDYFVKITADFSTVSYQINNENTASPVVNLTVETVGSKKDLEIWDSEMLVKLLEEALDEDDLEELEEDLDELMEDDEPSEEFVKLIKDNISSYMRDFEKRLDKELDKIERKNFVSLALNSNIIITYPVAEGSTVRGNRQVGGTWISQDITDYGTKKAIYTLYPGIYAFTATVLTIPGITGTANGTIITNLVARFGLDDYLGKGGAINTSGPLSRTAALGCIARISGAAKTDDPTIYLSGKGVSSTGRNSQVNISAQETIYLTMMAYQIRTNTKIETIQIRNYGATANIQGIANAYKKAVQAAFELGIYTNSNMNPNGTLTVKEFLEMLAALAKKTNLA